ncbi:hypothetical protein ACFLRF_03815 [Candidatus Altiarchaeota archaeon]
MDTAPKYMALAAIIALASVSSATRVDSVIDGVDFKVNHTAGGSFNVSVRLKYPCNKAVWHYLDERFIGIAYSHCKEHATLFTYSNRIPEVNFIEPGWHDLRIQVYDHHELVSHSDERMLVLAGEDEGNGLKPQADDEDLPIVAATTTTIAEEAGSMEAEPSGATRKGDASPTTTRYPQDDLENTRSAKKISNDPTPASSTTTLRELEPLGSVDRPANMQMVGIIILVFLGLALLHKIIRG